MTSILPFYLRTEFKDDPLFENAKIVSSVYSDGFQTLNDNLGQEVLW